MMKVVILAGGKGTRLAEETQSKPKPMVEIGGKPILWHIMKHFSYHGFYEFVIALGYKGELIKEYVLGALRHRGNITVDFATKKIDQTPKRQLNWKVHLIDTGLETLTGGRVKRLQNILDGERFFLTYGDGVADIDLEALLDFHKNNTCVATVTAVHPASRFGNITFNENRIEKFAEKSQVDVGWINGGFMVMEPEIFDYLENDDSVLESDALEELARNGRLAGYKHEGFWQCMDSLRDRNLLQTMWESGKPAWKIW